MPPITKITDKVRERLLTELTGEGSPYEIITENIRGANYRVFKNAPQNLKEFYALGMAREGFFPELITRWFGEQDWPFMVYLDERYTFKEAWQKAARLSFCIERQVLNRKRRPGCHFHAQLSGILPGLYGHYGHRGRGRAPECLVAG